VMAARRRKEAFAKAATPAGVNGCQANRPGVSGVALIGRARTMAANRNLPEFLNHPAKSAEGFRRRARRSGPARFQAVV
jgi:hypothetical protein